MNDAALDPIAKNDAAAVPAGWCMWTELNIF